MYSSINFHKTNTLVCNSYLDQEMGYYWHFRSLLYPFLSLLPSTKANYQFVLPVLNFIRIWYVHRNLSAKMYRVFQRFSTFGVMDFFSSLVSSVYFSECFKCIKYIGLEGNYIKKYFSKLLIHVFLWTGAGV